MTYFTLFVFPPIGHIRAAALLATGNRFCTPSLELKCLRTSQFLVGQKKSFNPKAHFCSCLANRIVTTTFHTIVSCYISV